jgi:hypothetical protein
MKEGMRVEKLSLSGTSKHSTDDTMRGLSAVFVDGGDVFVDNGAIHAKSRLERSLQFVKRLEDVPNPRHVWGLWITLHRFEGGKQGYYGAVPFQLWLDAEAGVGYKSLSEQVNGMDKAVKGKIGADAMPVAVRAQVAEFLKTVRPELWENAHEPFLAAFADGQAETD